MLSLDLVRVKIRGKRIYPCYVDVEDGELLELCRRLLGLVPEYFHRPRAEVEEALRAYEKMHGDYLLVRGLVKLLLDRMEFSQEVGFDPLELRHRVFELAAEGRRRSRFSRRQVMERVCEEFGIGEAVFEDGFYADLKSQQRLNNFRRIEPRQLLERYNTALAQAILLRAVELRVWVKGTVEKYRQLFRYIKFFQLLFSLEKAEEGYWIHLDGPLNLFQSSTKYGVQLGNFLLALLWMPEFRMEGRVLWGKRKVKKVLEIGSEDGLRSHLVEEGQWMPPEFRLFLKRFEGLESEWRIEGNGDILVMPNNGVCVPDYRFWRPDLDGSFYLELFGYWRRQNLTQRLKWLERGDMPPVILAVSSQLCVGQGEGGVESPFVYVYKGVLLPQEVLKRLEILAEKSSPNFEA